MMPVNRANAEIEASTHWERIPDPSPRGRPSRLHNFADIVQTLFEALLMGELSPAQMDRAVAGAWELYFAATEDKADQQTEISERTIDRVPPGTLVKHRYDRREGITIKPLDGSDPTTGAVTWVSWWNGPRSTDVVANHLFGGLPDMSRFEEESSAAVARQNAIQQNAADRASLAARGRREAEAFADRQRRFNTTGGPVGVGAQAKPSKSAKLLAESSTVEARTAAAKARRKAEQQREAEALRRALNPPPRDPRTSGEKIADRYGYSTDD